MIPSVSSLAPDLPELRKARGAFFTPPAIAEFLAAWAIDRNPAARVLDPTCGEAVFLTAAGRQLRTLGATPADLDHQVYGVDLHQASLEAAMALLELEGLDAHLEAGDFFEFSPTRSTLPAMDAVIGNPPFVRYQHHAGEARKRSAAAALGQGVRLSALASSWAALLVHACGFLKPEGRLAIVLPAELLTVHYAEPVRRWLRQRFAAVNLVLFERLQFSDALEKVVLLTAQGSGGCESFSLFHVENAEDLGQLRPFDHVNVKPAAEGKWTDLLLPGRTRQLFKQVTSDRFVSLGDYGAPELGTVTGANHYFALSEGTRRNFGLTHEQVARISPPGTRHLHGLSFSRRQWERLRDHGESVWLLRPPPDDATPELRRYLEHGERRGVPDAYKCRVRTPWWRPPLVSPPDLFFTYMSHRYPRLVTNSARASFLNSMHGVRLRSGAPAAAKAALPLLALNSVSLLGAELFGRSYGGGVLKMEPREAALLPVPGVEVLDAAWRRLGPERSRLNRELRAGRWASVSERVDGVLLGEVLGLGPGEVSALREAADSLRARRLGGDER
jgi:hypothetical protein